MSTVADVTAAAPSFKRLLKPNPRVTARRNVGTEAVMAWVCLQTDAAAALNVIGGTSQTFACYGGTVTRIVPLIHPTYTWLMAEEVVAEDMGLVDGGTVESHTKITVTFRSPNYGLTGDNVFIEYSGGPDGRTLAPPTAAYQAGNRPATGTNVQPINGAQFQLILHQMPGFNLGDWLAHANSVNLNPWFGCPSGTVLFTGPQWQMSQQLAGVTTWRTSLGFKATDPNFPWNKGYLDDGTWGNILKADGNPYYPTFDFSNLIVA